MSRVRVALLCISLMPTDALAQRTNDNAVTAAEDAFGTSIGNETIGLYTTSQVRGFSPVTAGNVRIEGVYIDRQGAIAQRLVSGSTIRVGLSAQGYLFPAPTGIVDYRLRDVGEKTIISVVAGSYPYGAPTLEVDAQFPLLGQELGVAAGISHAHEEYYDGSDAHYTRIAVIPRWRPLAGIEIIPFWSRTIGKDEQVAPTVIAAGSFAVPEAPRRTYFGQQWAAKDSESVNTGTILKARLDENWSVTAGAFRSVFINEQNFAELFLNTTPAGMTTERVIADPGQRYASTSGEVRLTHSLVEGERLHSLTATVRARDLDSRYGGAAPAIDLGERPLGQSVPVPEPAAFGFAERAHDRVRQTTYGLTYNGRWREVGELGLGLQRVSYRKAVDLPGNVPATESRDDPWLLNASFAGYLSDDVAVYGSYTRGLEESGLAPNNAANRNEALPAIRTTQMDAGMRWTVTPSLRLIAGLFDVRKPYFSTNQANLYTALGDVRHRGIELSLSGDVTEDISLVAGGLLMDPRVSGEAVTLGQVGAVPLNQPRRVLRANVEYRPPFLSGFSFDVALSNFSARAASRDNVVWLEPYSLADIGLRYRFNWNETPVVLRVQVANIADTFSWNAVGSNSYGLTDRRRITAYLAVDL